MKNDHYQKPEVGMLVFVVHTNRSMAIGSTITIAKVARKWATLSNGERFDISTWVLDPGNYNNFGNVYQTEQDYIEEQAINMCWMLFRRKISDNNKHSDIVTIERIKQAAEILGIKL
jgi:hypothetical protein